MGKVAHLPMADGKEDATGPFLDVVIVGYHDLLKVLPTAPWFAHGRLQCRELPPQPGLLQCMLVWLARLLFSEAPIVCQSVN